MNDPLSDRPQAIRNNAAVDELQAAGGCAHSLDFLRFCLETCGNDGLPIYERFDPMMRPKLVPDMFVVDLRNGYQGGLLIKFSGTKIDTHFGRNIQGTTLEEVYRGDMDLAELVARYHRCADQREIYFRQRASQYDDGARGIARGAQDLVIVPMTSTKYPESGVGPAPKVSYLYGHAAFEITDNVTKTIDRFISFAAEPDEGAERHAN